MAGSASSSTRFVASGRFRSAGPARPSSSTDRPTTTDPVAHLRISFEVSERRACKVLGADRTSVRYRGRRAGDAIVRARLRELAAIRRRFGYRRLLVLMRREGLVMNHKKFRRLYRKER